MIRAAIAWILVPYVLCAQVLLPYETQFSLADQQTVMQLWGGPWDQNLRCDALDSLRFGPTCCTQGQYVPWMGMAPNNYSCQHLASQFGGHYLRMVKSYSASGAPQSIWASPQVMTPRFAMGSLPVLSIRAAKNTLHMSHLMTPWSNWSSHGNAFSYAALEVALVDSIGGSALVLDTLELTNTWTLQHVDVRNYLSQAPNTSRFRLKMLGDGDVAIDWVRITTSPTVTWSATSSCSSTNPNGSITVHPIPGFTLPVSFAWNTGATGPTVTGLNPGHYVVSATDANGLFAERSITVGAMVTMVLDSLRPIGPLPGTAWFSVQGSGSITWNWSGPNGFQSSLPQPSITLPGWYTLTATDSLGCSAAHSIFIGLACSVLQAPSAFTDSTCQNEVFVPVLPNSPSPNLAVRYWINPTDTLLTLGLPPSAAFPTAASGWLIRYARWVDTLQACVGPGALCSLWVAPSPVAPAPYTWERCAQSVGFSFPWSAIQGSTKLQWRTPSTSSWTWGAPPNLTGTQTNAAGASYALLTRYVDTLFGCEGPVSLSTYDVKMTYQAALNGSSSYQYGLLHQVQSLNLPPGMKHWTVNYGGRFEMANPGHPCHNTTSCWTTDATLFVRGTVVPCWSPPTVTVSVSQAATGLVCDSLSTLTASQSGSYSCFSTQIDSAQSVAWTAPGDSLRFSVTTIPNGYSVPGNPLMMSYASCSFSIPYRWEVRSSGGPWIPLSQVIPASGFSTQTGTNLISLVVLAATPVLHGYEVRLALERCQGIWDFSPPGMLRIGLTTDELNNSMLLDFGPNPSTNHVRFQVQVGQPDCRVHIVNSNGASVMEFVASEHAREISLTPGIYFVWDCNGIAQRLVVL